MDQQGIVVRPQAHRRIDRRLRRREVARLQRRLAQVEVVEEEVADEVGIPPTTDSSAALPCRRASPDSPAITSETMPSRMSRSVAIS
jgi:hypothetical protein